MNGGIRSGGGPATHDGRALARRLPPLLARLRGPLLDDLARRLCEASPTGGIPEADAAGEDAPTAVGVPGAAAALLADLLTVEGRRCLDARREVERTRSGFLTAVRRAPDALALQALLRHHLRTTRAGRDLRGDLGALKRWLDADALVERMDGEFESLGAELEVIVRLLEGLPLREQAVELLRGLCADPRPATRRAAVAVLAAWAVARVHESGSRAIPSEILRGLLQIARQRQEDPLAARAAMQVLLAVDPEEQEAMFLERLTPPEQRAAEADEVVLGTWLRDDFLVRAEAARLSQRAASSAARRACSLAQRDPSETVRCALADGLAERNDMTSLVQLERLAREDPAPAVRLHARAHLGLCRGEGDPRDIPDPAAAQRPRTQVPPADSSGNALADLGRELAGLREGQARTVALPEGRDALQLARALLPWVEHDHGFCLEPRGTGRVRVLRGERTVPRAWRLLHEIRNPGPAKRPGGDHISGSTAPAPIRVPPARMAEVSPTGVPNQRVWSAAWGGWAPWLPQPEDFLDALGHGTTWIVTREGLTTIEAPSRARRLWAALWLVGATAGLDRDRRQALAAGDAAERQVYVQRLRRAGFTVRFAGHDEEPQVHAAILQFFDEAEDPPQRPPGPGVQVMSLAGPLLWGGLRSLIGWRHNLPAELAAVCVALAVLLLTRLVLSLRRIRLHRRRIPLVLGGWGTRGKSGTERLKAAFFQGLGYNPVCKTTGCEAVLLHAPPGGRALELFLYRPYERASIWEHAEVMGVAAGLAAPVFLWECMALRSDYVEQLQLLWTRDDLSTITNTYPDHEDVQGPTGRRVAETISSFVPRGSLLVCTEQQMLPVLRDRCAARRTRLEALTEEHVASLPADLLARIPYQEHPANVALTAHMAALLGVPQEEAVIHMADHVVPDLGALATYGPLRHLGRTIEFINGMSANDRTGFVNNWQRSGFSALDPRTSPRTFCVTVVNNRRDRVARSRVFAEILTQDAPAHRHVLIGTNLEGLRAYLAEALAARTERLDPFGAGPDGVAQRLGAMASFLRIPDPVALIRATATDLRLPPAEVADVTGRIEALLRAVEPEPQTLAEAAARLSPLRGAVEALAGRAGGVFAARAAPGAASVHPRLEPPLFHDDDDRERGTDGLADQWLAACAEALAFAALRQACLGQSRGEGPPPPAPMAPPRGRADDDVTELFDETEEEFWGAGDDEPIATLPAEDTDPGSGAGLASFGPAPVLVEDAPDPGHLGTPAAPREPPTAARQATLRAAARRLFREVFLSHVRSVPSPEASGDEIIDAVARACPAGTHLLVMGIQNIKGTGLDFVYRWVHTVQPLRWMEDLLHPDRTVQMAALSRLERWREWSIPLCQEVLRGLAVMPTDAGTAQASAAARDLVAAELARRRSQMGLGGGRPLRPRVLQALWQLWDPFDALLRRWTSDRIWADLCSQRISHARAARELARLSARQRGEDLGEDVGLVP